MAVEQPHVMVAIAEALQAKPTAFNVSDVWLNVNPGYVGIYFSLTMAVDEVTEATIACHVTMLHGTQGNLRGHQPKAATVRNLANLMNRAMSTWNRTSPGYPIVFALSDPVQIELKDGNLHRVLVVVHKDSLLHAQLFQCRQVAECVHKVHEDKRLNLHVSVDKIFVTRRGETTRIAP